MQGLKQRNKSDAARQEVAGLLRQALSRGEQRHAKLRYFKDGVVGVSVDSSVWLYHLNLKKEELLKTMREESATVVKDIRFHLGERS